MPAFTNSPHSLTKLLPNFRVGESYKVSVICAVCVLPKYLGFDVFSDKTLCDDINTLTVTQDVSSALRVVHKSFDAANQWGVDLGLGGLIVHWLEEIQDTRQAIQLNESCHKPEGDQSQIKLRLFFRSLQYRGELIEALGNLYICRITCVRTGILPHWLCPQCCL